MLKTEQMIAPRFAANNPDHGLELEEALEPHLIATINLAMGAGWAEDDIWAALKSLVANLEQASIENTRTEKAIAAARTHLAKPQ
jgi:hypothetical protein